MSLADVHLHAQRFQSRIRSRNMIEYGAAVFVVAAFVWMAVTIPEPVVRVGAALIIAGALYVCWKLHELGRAATRGELDAGAQSWAAFHRAELTRQRNDLAQDHLCDATGVGKGRIKDRDATDIGGVQIDLVGADAEATDREQIGGAA